MSTGKTVTGIMLVFLTFLLLTAGGFAEEQATPEDVYRKTLQAHSVLKELGKDGLAAFQAGKSDFVWKDSYVWVIECGKWTNAAHPTMPNLVGMDLKNIKCEKTGKLFFQEFCEVGKKPQGGWVEYYWPKPGHPKEELFRKITFVIPVEGTPWLVAAGIYNDTMSIEELNKAFRFIE